MTCEGCQAKVQKLLLAVPGVTAVSVNLEKGEADITMSHHIATETLSAALKEYPKYQLTEKAPAPAINVYTEPEKSWFATYKPILLIFGYIISVTTLISISREGFDGMLAMRVFMGGFFLTFSFFKMLDLKGFADSYSMYDIVAKRVYYWGYMYVFIELLLSISFIVNFAPFATNLVTLVVMTVSIIGVLQSVLDKKKIKCACLGAVFELPMSTVTIIEDGLMIAMSAVMLFLLK